VNGVVDFPEVRYAVIEVLQTETGHERIVIAYQSEESLRDLIAAPSIVASGLASRDEAVMRGEVSFRNGVVHQQMPEAIAGAATIRPRHRLHQKRRRETGSMSRKVGRFVSTCCGDVLTWTTVILSSSNFVLVAIRMALGSSV
jgi:hypothetical protein